jgi:hypothetical protein
MLLRGNRGAFGGSGRGTETPAGELKRLYFFGLS